MHHLRGTCPNDLTERSEVQEEQILHALQGAVQQQPDVVDYTIQRLETQLKAKLDNIGADLEALRRRKHTLQCEIKRLTDALASASDSRPPSAVMAAINERKEERRNITDRLLQGSRDSIRPRLSDIRQFVISKVSD